MYQGLGPTMLANLPRGAIYFTVYHKINDSSKERYGESTPLCTLSKQLRAVLTSGQRAKTYVGILKHIRSRWGHLLYIIDQSIVGYQDSTHVTDKCRYQTSPKRI
jgi:hypothetical protein